MIMLSESSLLGVVEALACQVQVSMPVKAAEVEVLVFHPLKESPNLCFEVFVARPSQLRTTATRLQRHPSD